MSLYVRTAVPGLAFADLSAPHSAHEIEFGQEADGPACCIICGCEDGPCGTVPVRVGMQRAENCPHLRPLVPAAFDRFSPVPWSVGLMVLGTALWIGV